MAQNSCHISKQGLQRREGARGGAHKLTERGFFRTLPPLNQILPGANPSHQCTLMTARAFLTEASFPSHLAPAKSRGFTPDVTRHLGGKKKCKKDGEKPHQL